MLQGLALGSQVHAPDLMMCHREDPEQGPVVAGLSRITVESAERIISLLQVCCPAGQHLGQAVSPQTI